MMEMNSLETQRTNVCQICLHPIAANQPAMSCPTCRSPYHQDCWEELGGCAVYGCAQMVEVCKAEEVPVIWGASEKKCPVCAEKIPVVALQCPYCKTNFTDIRPMEPEEFLQKADDPVLVGYRRKAIWLLVFGVLGFTSPLVLLIGGLWYWSKRHEIERAGSSVRGMILIALTISAVYIVLIGFGLLVFSFKGGEI